MSGTPLDPVVTVLMPTVDQAAFLRRAVRSLLAQRLSRWELAIVDDGSLDATPHVVRRFLDDDRIRYLRLPENRGLGEALNTALSATTAPYVAYLPSDDVYAPQHLETLLRALSDPRVVLAWSGVRHHQGASSLEAPAGHSLQLVQVMHRRVPDRWTTRAELETDDLERLYWSRVRRHGLSRATGRVTCQWTDHPEQRHKRIRESYDGGLNVFRSRYRVRAPLRFQSSDSELVDETQLYASFRDRPPTPAAADGLQILLVGELAYNPERILAFEERGHRLFGLWTRDGLGDQTVGPLPFGHVTDLPHDQWESAVRTIAPDVIYALLNWRAVPFAHAVLNVVLGVPFVWHFKESPQACIRGGTWHHLVDLVTRSDAAVFSTPEEAEWFQLMLPGQLDRDRTMVLDGDLPKADWLSAERSPRLSAQTGQIHTVVLGRPIGLDGHLVKTLASNGIHVHFHGLVRGRGPTGEWQYWLDEARAAAPGHVHVHARIDRPDWVRVLSRYDAGWLHQFDSRNAGDLRQASWDDLNYPARLPTYVAGGLPLIHRRSPGSTVAAERLLGRHGIGLCYEDEEELVEQLRDGAALNRLSASAWRNRHEFTFDAHCARLVERFQRLRCDFRARR